MVRDWSEIIRREPSVVVRTSDKKVFVLPSVGADCCTQHTNGSIQSAQIVQLLLTRILVQAVQPKYSFNECPGSIWAFRPSSAALQPSDIGAISCHRHLSSCRYKTPAITEAVTIRYTHITDPYIIPPLHRAYFPTTRVSVVIPFRGERKSPPHAARSTTLNTSAVRMSR